MNEPTYYQLATKPYKGPQSYQVEDADLFFGREREAAQLIAKILSSRFTLLHAQSGAGKTSLLNARVIPGLESRSWGAFRILPHNDPTESVQSTTLRYILPPLEAEVQAIERAQQALSSCDAHPSLEQLVSYYDSLPIRDVRRRSLLVPIQLPSGATPLALPDWDQVTPWFCRLLRSSIEIDEFAEHLAALQQEGDAPVSTSSPISGATLVCELLEMLSQATLASAYRTLFAQLNVPVSDLWTFFENLFQIYGQRRSRFALVLIFDQFEEIFTRFIDPGPVVGAHLTDLPDWRLRGEFFTQLERLYRTEFEPLLDASKGESKAGKTLLPIRYVISMRDEYIAQLDPIRRFVWDLNDNAYHLGLLEKGEATEAIQKPAGLFGYSYSDACYRHIIDQLTKEDRFIEPAHLQIVCDKLWNERGRELAEHNVKYVGEEEAPQIELHTFLDLGGTKGILQSFFSKFLQDLDDASRLETLEMLEPLITGSGTRNILERDELLRAPFRDERRRAHLLRNLEDRTIVRTERRLGGYFVEITHEFLIGPILEAVRPQLRRGGEYTRVRWALRTLVRFEEMYFVVGGRGLLTPPGLLCVQCS